MLLFELDNYVSGRVTYNDSLNPKIYDENNNMRPEVHEALMAVTENFLEDLDLPNMVVHDVVITGSAASYNWTKYSDVDLHIISDVDVFADPHMAAKYFTAAKNVWNNNHDVDIRGIEVEVYVEDNDERNAGATSYGIGRYSVMNDKWIRTPIHNVPSFDEAAVNRKVKYIMKEIDMLMQDDDAVTDIHHLKTKIWLMRGEGLQREGEYSVENLSFKVLRNLGYLDKIRDALNSAEDRQLSVENMKINEIEDPKGRIVVHYNHQWADEPFTMKFYDHGQSDEEVIKQTYKAVGGRNHTVTRITESQSPTVEDVGAFYAKYKTDDWQNRGGNYPKSGVPDTVDNAGSYGDEAFIEFSFKNTPESRARGWVHGWLKSKRLPFTKIDSGQDGDYKDDWVMVYVTYKAS